MPLAARLLALLVAATWGLNFVAIHLSLEQFPPLLCAAVRFTVIAVPVVLLVPRPRGVPVRRLLEYGAGFGVAQFVFLYTAMAVGMPAGLASLVLQSSAPFTVVLAGFLLRERLTGRQVTGVVVAVGGLTGIALSRAALGGAATLLPVLLTLLGGLGWAFGNLAARLAWRDRVAAGAPPSATESLRLVLWVSVVPPLPLAAASLVLEGPTRIAGAFVGLGTRVGLLALAGLAFTVLVATLVGQVVWSALMARHPSSAVAPFSMLVPVVGMLAAHVVLGETTPWREVALGVVVVSGVLLGASRPRRTSCYVRNQPDGYFVRERRWASPRRSTRAARPSRSSTVSTSPAAPRWSRERPPGSGWRPPGRSRRPARP